MRDEDWRGLDDEALQRLLIERWLYRGATLAVVFFAALTVSWLGSRGLRGLADQITVGVFLALGLASGAVAWVMRQQDLRMHRELRRRRTGRDAPPVTSG